MDPTKEAIRWAYGCLAREVNRLFYSNSLAALADSQRMNRLAEFINSPDKWVPALFQENQMWRIQRMQDPCQLQP